MTAPQVPPPLVTAIVQGLARKHHLDTTTTYQLVTFIVSEGLALTPTVL
jgi:hypothetical protein